MEVLPVIALLFGSAVALGSGPYLPRGWRPEGPAFLLPFEVTRTKPSENLLRDTILQGSAVSGSEYFREYGLPKVQEVSQDLTVQSLPDVITDRTFFDVDIKFKQKEENNVVKTIKESTSVNTEFTTQNYVMINLTEASVQEDTKAPNLEETTTELVLKSLIQAKSDRLVIEASVAETTDGFIEAAETTESNKQSDILVTEEQAVVNDGNIFELITREEDVKRGAKQLVRGEQKVKTKKTEQTVNTREENLYKIEENFNSQINTFEIEKKTQANKEKDVKSVAEKNKKIEDIGRYIMTQEAKAASSKQEHLQEAVLETILESSGSLDEVPVGFLEYGPPGFKEYGPPKEDKLTTSRVEGPSSEIKWIKTNDARKRQFSPKFRAARIN